MATYLFRYEPTGVEFYATEGTPLYGRVTSGRGLTENTCLGEVDPKTYEPVTAAPKRGRKPKAEAPAETPVDTPAVETPAETTEVTSEENDNGTDEGAE